MNRAIFKVILRKASEDNYVLVLPDFLQKQNILKLYGIAKRLKNM
jgi:hypothetical protein